VKVRLVQEFRFEAAHRLPKVPPGHRCSNLHGHSYRIEVAVRGDVDEEMGWLIDYQRVLDVGAPIFVLLDHRYLNEVPGLENPTSEVLARWLWERFSQGLDSMGASPPYRSGLPRLLDRVTVYESADARCEYDGD
jgi:6-pyruvoyltetrahydropterin/6-carboxytetrahydropterin synthase